MTENPFPDLALQPPEQEGTTGAGRSRSGTGFLSDAAGKLGEVWNYFDNLKRPTSAENIAPLHQLLQNAESYLNTLRATTDAVQDVRESAKEAAAAARLCAQTFEFSATEWARRDAGPRRPLNEVSQDYRALLEVQNDLKKSVRMVANRLRKLAELTGEVSPN